MAGGARPLCAGDLDRYRSECPLPWLRPGTDFAVASVLASVSYDLGRASFPFRDSPAIASFLWTQRAVSVRGPRVSLDSLR